MRPPDLRPWGEPETIRPLGGGARNAVWEVTIAGRRLVARETGRPGPALDWELRLLEYLHRSGIGVTVPVPAADGRRRIGSLCVFEYVEGRPPASPDDWRQVAATLRQLHEQTADWPQRPGFLACADLLTEDRGGDVRLDRMPDDVVALCRRAWAPIAEEPRSVVHGDPGADNVRLVDGRVVLLDWDEARVDAFVLDLSEIPTLAVTPRARMAAVAWEVACSWEKEPAYARRRLNELRRMIHE